MGSNVVLMGSPTGVAGVDQVFCCDDRRSTMMAAAGGAAMMLFIMSSRETNTDDGTAANDCVQMRGRPLALLEMLTQQ